MHFGNDVYHALKDYIELEHPVFTPKNGWDDRKWGAKVLMFMETINSCRESTTNLCQQTYSHKSEAPLPKYFGRGASLCEICVSVFSA